MNAGERILFVALDACDPALAGRWAGEGKLPTLARLLGNASRARVENPYAIFVGSLWASFATARNGARAGFHCWEVVGADYRRREADPLEIRGETFWARLARAGRRVAILDVPHSRVDVRGGDGVQVVEWGCHDRHYGFQTSPPALADSIEAEVGLHPILGANAREPGHWAPDDYVLRAGPHRTPEEETALVDGLIEGTRRKRRLSCSLYRRGDWDLFLTVFGESHAVGHQVWHVHDPQHPSHDPRIRRRLGDPIERVYVELDAAVGELLDQAGPDVTVFVHLSHGMGPHYDGTHLLEEILRRIEAADRQGIPGAPLRAAAKRLWSRVPPALGSFPAKALAARLRAKLRRGPVAPSPDDYASPEERVARRFFASPNNFVFAGVRFNVVGREVCGQIQPGRELQVACERLGADLLALINVDTGKPVVRRVSRTDSHYPRRGTDLLPDLLLDWSHETPIETVWSPKTGVVHVPYSHWRTGDHKPDGLLLAYGPGIEAGRDLGVVQAHDLGATICARLGVELDDVDGRAVPALSRTVPLAVRETPSSRPSASGRARIFGG